MRIGEHHQNSSQLSARSSAYKLQRNAQRSEKRVSNFQCPISRTTRLETLTHSARWRVLRIGGGCHKSQTDAHRWWLDHFVMGVGLWAGLQPASHASECGKAVSPVSTAGTAFPQRYGLIAAGIDMEAVSYTHLTLPTNREV